MKIIFIRKYSKLYMRNIFSKSMLIPNYYIIFLLMAYSENKSYKHIRVSKLEKVKIITDSTCDLSVDELKELNVEFVPAYVIIEGKKFKQNVNITNDEVYHQLIKEKKKIGSAASSPGEFFKVYEKALEEAESLIVLTVHGKLSAVYSTARMVAEKFFPKRDISVIDTKTASFAQAILVQEAAQMLKLGKSKEEIVERITFLAEHAKALPLLDTLEYLYRGGRIKLYQRLIGNLLGVKALVLIDKKGSNLDAKVKGKKNALIQMKMCGLQILDNLMIKKLYVAYTDNKDLAIEVADFLKENGPTDVEIAIGQLGSVVGVHGGNDLVGFAFVGHYKSEMFTKVGETTKDFAKEKKSFSVKG